MINLSSSTHKAASVGQMSMFDTGSFDAPQTGSILYPLPEVTEVSQKEILAWEKELVGAYLSDHPIQKYLADIKAANTVMLGELDETMNGRVVNVAGLINSVRPHQSKKGEPMAFVEIEDTQAVREIVVFPRVYAAHKALLSEGRLIFVRGKVDAPEGREPKILADSLSTEFTTYHATETQQPVLPGANGVKSNGQIAEPAAPYQLAPPPPPFPEAPPAETPPASRWLHITIPRTNNLVQDKARLKEVYKLLVETPGNDQFSFYIPDGHRKIRIDFPNQTTRDTAHLRQRLTQVLGPTAIHVD
jgi:DNA polymerase-3 subunit alpha